jgi:hypothetical protein
VSSTTGLKSGSLLNELDRQKRMRIKAMRRAQVQRERAEKWKRRALAAEFMLARRVGPKKAA